MAGGWITASPKSAQELQPMSAVVNKRVQTGSIYVRNLRGRLKVKGKLSHFDTEACTQGSWGMDSCRSQR